MSASSYQTTRDNFPENIFFSRQRDIPSCRLCFFGGIVTQCSVIGGYRHSGRSLLPRASNIPSSLSSLIGSSYFTR